jgi:hypothetical protein
MTIARVTHMSEGELQLLSAMTHFHIEAVRLVQTP